jgi:hypothetical protein
MNGKTIINIEKPQTQAVKAVCGLLAWKGRSSNPLPEFVEMGSGEGKVVLVLSNKRDSYYTCTKSDCSCPASVYHHGPCKHQRKYFPEVKATTKPTDSILPKREPFRPFIEDAPVKASTSFQLVDTLADPTPRDLAYHSIQADREMWPKCEA